LTILRTIYTRKGTVSGTVKLDRITTGQLWPFSW